MNKKEQLKQEILEKTKEYYNLVHKNKRKFIPGETFINYGGRFFDENEVINLVDSSLEFWLTSGHWAEEFEEKFARYLNIKYCSLTNSGSSANLLAFMALTSPKLGEKRIKKGDEVITVAAGFPTTVTPIIQYGAIPVFVDVELPSYNIDVTELEKALSNKTKAIMVAHTLGNPFNLKEVKEFCDKNKLWLIEDNCDALGSEYFIDGEWKKTGTIGDIGTSSFYPPHHMTMGEGGAVYTNNSLLNRLINSFRDWGRDCWCKSGVDNTCNHRFSKQYGELPLGYDHKYVYSHFGYNLKATDMQASIGVAQLNKLENIVNRRRYNWKKLNEGLKSVSDVLILPEAEANSNPSWFGFIISVKENNNITRKGLVEFLEKNKIQTRNLFAGNLIKHPAFDEMRKTNTGYKQIGNLKNTDFIMKNTFWIGVYPGITDEMLDYMILKIKEYIKINK
ncbi:lipopolysaccharide biosynthesis protein RfbH [Tepiditoga spiralis]